jgi:MFS transporter, ACS family, glucarate transporter
MTVTTAVAEAKRSRVRIFIVLMLFLVTTVNYADRATLSIAGTALSKELHLDPVALGYVFSAFGWSYVAAQVPGGWLLDRFGSKLVYTCSILFWSAFTFMQGWIGFFTAGTAVVLLFGLRFLVGLAEAPSFPANARIVAAWFPSNERGTASAFFNSGQYFATVMFAPLMGWIAHDFGWRYVFFTMGVLGLVMGVIWIMTIHGPKDHPGVNAIEFDYIKQGGALVDLDAGQGADSGPKWAHIKQLLGNRMMVGVYLGQYCINALTYFFLTWFPVYLVKERGLTILQAGFVATLPALCGFFGGVLGGVISDAILRKTSITLARKIPIVGGMLLSMSIIGCNYVAAFDVDHRMQLRRRTGFHRRPDGAGLFRQGHRCARMGRRIGHFAQGSRWRLGWAVQHVRQSVEHHNANHRRLHPQRHRLVQWRAGVHRRQCPCRRDRLSLRRR